MTEIEPNCRITSGPIFDSQEYGPMAQDKATAPEVPPPVAPPLLTAASVRALSDDLRKAGAGLDVQAQIARSRATRCDQFALMLEQMETER